MGFIPFSISLPCKELAIYYLTLFSPLYAFPRIGWVSDGLEYIKQDNIIMNQIMNSYVFFLEHEIVIYFYIGTF